MSDGLAYNQIDATVEATPKPNNGVGVKSNNIVDVAHVHNSASTVANVLSTLPANLMTKAVSSAPATCTKTTKVEASTRTPAAERRRR